MGQASTLKTLRKQLRNVVKEQLKEVMTTEVLQDISKAVMTQLGALEREVGTTVNKRLDVIESRYKDVKSMIDIEFQNRSVKS